MICLPTTTCQWLPTEKQYSVMTVKITGGSRLKAVHSYESYKSVSHSAAINTG